MGNQCVALVGGSDENGEATPKSLLDIGRAPFLETLLGEARRRGFDDILVLVERHGEAIADFLAKRDVEIRLGCRIEMSVQSAPLGVGRALVRALPQLRNDFLLLDGDLWFDFNWLDLIVRARDDGASAAVALRETVGPGRHAIVETDGSHVLAVHPPGERVGSALTIGGVYYFSRQAIEESASRRSLVSETLPRLASDGALRGYRYSGFFIDIGAPDGVAAAQQAPSRRRRPAVFLDRDGVLNVDRGYVHAWHEVDWVRGAKQAVKLLNDSGYYAFVVTNQAGVAKGLYGEEAIGALHRWMGDELASIGASVDDWRYCPYHPEGSVAAYRAAHAWRKPSPGMLLDLLAHWPIERERSFLIGDKTSDVEAAEAVGIPGYLFQGGDLLAFLQERLRLGQGSPVAAGA